MRRRRLLLLLWLLPLLLLLAVAGRVALLAWDDHGGRGAFADARAGEARGPFGRNAVLNPFEPWIAPYDEGTAALVDGDPDEARALLETALPLAPPPEECRVRINLALAHEALGRAAADAGDLVGAQVASRAGRQVLADGGCLDEAEQLDRLDRLDARDQDEDEEREAEARRERVRERVDQARDVDRRLAQQARQAARELERLRRQQERAAQEAEDPQVRELESRNERGEQQRERQQRQRERSDDQPTTTTW